MNAAWPAAGRLAGIDFGTVRIGIALTDASRLVASPYENYTRRSPELDARYFRELADQEAIQGFVVGLPIHASGHESEKSRQARQFGEWLRNVTGRPVRWFDERYTTAHARELLGDSPLSGPKRRRRLDMLAAQILLASFLEAASHAQPGPLDDPMA
jgi:putative Holliday junction resolvase